MKRYDLATILLVFLLFGLEVLALIIIAVMLTHEKYFPKNEVKRDKFYDINS
jgi:hypothetical protein